MSITLLNRPADEPFELETAMFTRNFPWVVQKRTFRHSIDIFLKDSNATGNVYFARHFEWQGICREKWFFDCISSDMLQPLGVFVTKEAQQKYLRETYAFQRVECEINTFEIKRCSFSLLFKFFVAGALVATGHQQIAFANLNKKITRLPIDILEKIRLYEVNMAKPGFISFS